MKIKKIANLQVGTLFEMIWKLSQTWCHERFVPYLPDSKGIFGYQADDHVEPGT